ncbi:dipeptide epimerase [Pigmentiphaga soli]|uniref:Dipeptide epimerase n=1 Tax=Pigmentiphaga soli TaxID=1007095 RepID=A0ABP8H0D1_9BURK
MKITKVSCEMVTIPYKNPYRMAPGETRSKKQILVFIETDEGFTGVGESGVTLLERGGESQEAIYIAIKKYLGPLVLGMDPFEIGRIIDTMEGSIQGRTGNLCAKAAIDTALYDIMGKATGRPVAALLGGVYRTDFGVSRSLGVKSPAEMGADALRLKAEGYAMLTVKAGFDPREDIERVAAVRDAVGADYPIEVDINGAYTVEVAIPTLKKMERYGIEAVEQPVAWWDLKGMREVRCAIDTPVTADESAWTPYDVANIAREGAADTICLKPIKNGGLYLSRRMAEIADAAGMGVLMGSKHPFGPGTSALIHFAAAIPAMHPVLGYGSPLERLVDDICDDPIRMVDGKVALPPGAGLGVTVSEEKMQKYRETFAI